MKRKLAVLALLAVPAGAQLLGIPGIGTIVFDPSNLGEAVAQTAKLVQQIQHAVATLKMITAQYDHMTFMAQYLPAQYRYRAPTTLWGALHAADTYGRNGAWIAAANAGVAAAAGWANATVPVSAYSGGFGGLSPAEIDWKQKQVAAIELMDGAGIGGLDTLGRIRAAGPAVETALGALEQDTLSQAPDRNTVAARQGTGNAIALLSAKTAADTNKLLVSHVEMSLTRMKQERDAAAMALISDALFRAQGDAALQAQKAGASSEMLRYRIP